MLTLNRKVNEEVVIEVHEPCEIVVAPLAIRGDRVTIGIEAPQVAASIHRREVKDAIDRERERGG